jgi:hypothetical protein
LRPGREAEGRLSLIRQLIGDNLAKQAAVTFVHHGEFWGFGRATVVRIAAHGQSLTVTTEPFEGHLDLLLGYPTPAKNPGEPEVVTVEYAKAIDLLGKLADEFEIIQDDRPEDNEWTGRPLGASIRSQLVESGVDTDESGAKSPEANCAADYIDQP